MLTTPLKKYHLNIKSSSVFKKGQVSVNINIYMQKIKNNCNFVCLLLLLLNAGCIISNIL